MDLPPIEYINIAYDDKYINSCNQKLGREHVTGHYDFVIFLPNAGLYGDHFYYNIIDVRSNSDPNLSMHNLLYLVINTTSTDNIRSMGLYGHKIGLNRYKNINAKIFIRTNFKMKIESMLHDSLRKIINV